MHDHKKKLKTVFEIKSQVVWTDLLVKFLKQLRSNLLIFLDYLRFVMDKTKMLFNESEKYFNKIKGSIVSNVLGSKGKSTTGL